MGKHSKKISNFLNKKLREKHDKKERKRIITLTNLAYQLDPRIKNQIAKENAEKEAIKEEKKKK